MPFTAQSVEILLKVLLVDTLLRIFKNRRFPIVKDKSYEIQLIYIPAFTVNENCE